MPELTIQPSINDLRGQSMLALTQRLAALHKSSIVNLLVYNFDAAPDSTLEFLAWQFDLIAPYWRLLLPTTAGKRSLLKASIGIHRKLGVPKTIKTALINSGYVSAQILEGQDSWGGTDYPPDQGWAVNRIVVGVASVPPVSSIVDWDQATFYPLRSFVRFNGEIFYNVSDAAAGVVPQFASVDDVLSEDDLTNVDFLVQYPWFIVLGAFVPVTPEDAQTISAIFDFFRPERSALDSVWFSFPPVIDVLLPAPFDTIGSIDILTRPHDTYSFQGQPIADPYSLPKLYNRRSQHAGITYVNQPVGPHDGAATVNGVSIEGNK